VLAALDADDRLRDYAPRWAARADLCRRAGDVDGAHEAYALAIDLTDNEAERRALRRAQSGRRAHDQSGAPDPSC
jgi:RNA polymerase sigma-70 factor (ECF subfamily)